MSIRIITAIIFLWSVISLPVHAEVPNLADGYRLLPGDVINISVWKEEDLDLDVVIRPDGGTSLPLIGEIPAAGLTIPQLRDELTGRFSRFIPDASVGVAVRQLLGNKIYVVGKVNHPGEFILNQQIDVVQALSKAGGFNPFADSDKIKIIRRSGADQLVFPFKYRDIEQGRQLEQNILLKSGDVVLVP